MTTKTVKLSPVASLEITARYYLVHEDGDIMADKATFHAEGIERHVYFILNGNKTEMTIIANDINRATKLHENAPADAEIYMSNSNDTRLYLRKENAEAFRKALDEAIAEETPAEYAERLEAEAEAKKADEIKHCEHVIAQCEKVLERKGKLMTMKEAQDWLVSYNNVVNEGGEGFLPKVWTLEEYENAKKWLSELTE